MKTYEGLILSPGAHSQPGVIGNLNGQMCLMEAVAWIAGESHTDRPQCVSPILGAYGRALNDSLGNTDRQRLVPLIPELIGTAGDLEADTARWFVLLDDLVRNRLPQLLKETTQGWRADLRVPVHAWASQLQVADRVQPGTLVRHLNSIRHDRKAAGITPTLVSQWGIATAATFALTSTLQAMNRVSYYPTAVRDHGTTYAARYAMKSPDVRLSASADDRIALFERMIRVGA